ncbi:hypothetical protein EJ03DRAFT_20538 [Teratosphaeria nubilosa]|uniref:Uncharacterized protein n=1 Tax=Teratosphaeria nubilosa TaxID=161662 RepID=A0A6G1LHJ7_9PEZI|nr:hypothetical protein EJ03DRAFT_20538 [Teratosphaeria nubilosa]
MRWTWSKLPTWKASITSHHGLFCDFLPFLPFDGLPAHYLSVQEYIGQAKAKSGPTSKFFVPVVSGWDLITRSHQAEAAFTTSSPVNAPTPAIQPIATSAYHPIPLWQKGNILHIPQPRSRSDATLLPTLGPMAKHKSTMSSHKWHDERGQQGQSYSSIRCGVKGTT